MPVVPMREILDPRLRGALRRRGDQRRRRPDARGGAGGGDRAGGAADRPDVAEDGEVDRRASRSTRCGARAPTRCRCRSPCTSTTARTASGSRPACETGWNSVLFDGSELDVAENTRQTIEVVAEADGYGAQVEGEIESVVGVEDGVGSEEGGEIHPVEVSAEFIAATGVYSFAPAIGTAHGLYKAEPKLTPERVTELVDAAPDPDGPARRHRPHRGAVRRPHRARLREGQHLDGAEDRVRRRPPRVPRRQPRQARPAGAPRATCARRSRRWRSTTSASSARRARRRRRLARPPERAGAHLRLRRRARRHRARRPPAGVQPDVRRGRPAGAWSEEEYGEKLRIGGGKERMASLLTADSSARTACPRMPTARGSCWPPGTAQDRDLHRDRRGRLPARPGHRARSSTRRSPRAGSWPSRPPRPSRRCGPCSSTSVGPTRPRASRSSRATSCPRSPPGHYRLALEDLGRCRRRRPRHRGFPQRSAGGGQRRACAAS